MSDTKKTIEEWKEELLPKPMLWKTYQHVTDTSTKFRRELNKGRWLPGEEARVGSKDWLFNSAKILNKWAVGEEMTKEEFEAGLDRAATHYVPRQ
ncbi:MAG: hypothetical protein EKK57_11205 [Proteobacteria bacterium]|nr:MAG: hypothetical protein EKK57_11205 [Pseudomonadota bacterium]